MKGKHKRYIKCVEVIPDSEYRQIPVFQSVMSAIGENLGTRVENHDHNTTFVFDLGGEIVEREIDEIVCNPLDFHNAFSDETTVMGVRLIWSDGEVEYGFKSRTHTEVVNRRYGKLVPIYTKDGVLNEETGQIEDLFDYDAKCILPAWVMKLLPMWNERIDDAVCNGDPSIETKYMSLDDWKTVWNVFRSNYTTTSVQWKEVTIDGKKVMRPVDMEFNNCPWFKCYGSDIKDSIGNAKYGASYNVMLNTSMKVFCYSYLKSIYQHHTSMRNVYRVYPISSLLLVKKRTWCSDIHDYQEKEVWNSLDETCKGNV